MAKTKRTPENREKILEKLRNSATQQIAYMSVGIQKSCFYNWLNEDVDFAEAVKEAESHCYAAHLEKIQGDKSWQSSAWYLERRLPENFALVSQIEKVLAKHGLIIVPSEEPADGSKPSTEARSTD